MKAFAIIGCWIVGASLFAPLVDRPKSQPTPEPVIQEAPKLPEPIDCEAKQFSVLRLKRASDGKIVRLAPCLAIEAMEVEETK